MNPASSRTALVSHAVNAVIVVCAAAILYAGWHYLHRVGYRFEAGVIIVGGLAAAALLTCLLARLEIRRNVAVLGALCLSFIAGNFALKLSGRRLAATSVCLRSAALKSGELT
jgi:hypothetical protein